jgi:methionyl-tRNA formyltransferase
MTMSLVSTVIGIDRPGIVNLLSDVAQRFGANWAGSRMASLAGQFAGIVHFEVPEQNAELLADALRGLVASGLQVVIAMGETSAVAAGRRVVKLELVGNDRPGIVRDLSGRLAARGVSIEELHTEVVSAAMSAGELFKVKAMLAVPQGLTDDELKRELEALATEMMVDIDLGQHASGAAPGGG